MKEIQKHKHIIYNYMKNKKRWKWQLLRNETQKQTEKNEGGDFCFMLDKFMTLFDFLT